jgi:nucleoside-diphosphate-sugar epimerase
LKQTVLVTGAGGFLGSHLCERWLSEGYRILAIDNFCTGHRSNRTFLESFNIDGQEPRVIFIEADVIQAWDSWLSQLPCGWRETIRYVFHFASPASPIAYQVLSLETLQVNSLGLQRALNFADEVKARLIFSSTSEIYGSSDVSPQTESCWGTVNSFGVRSCYSEAKRFGEALIFAHNKRHGTRHGLVRIFNTYGPRMNSADGRVIINFMKQAFQSEPLTVFGQGQQTRSFCFVSDMIEGIFRYAENGVTEPVNLGSPEEIRISDLAQQVGVLFSDEKPAITYHPMPEEDPTQRKPDILRARSLLAGWEPKIPLREGLRKMKSYYQTVDFRS